MVADFQLSGDQLDLRIEQSCKGNTSVPADHESFESKVGSGSILDPVPILNDRWCYGLQAPGDEKPHEQAARQY